MTRDEINGDEVLAGLNALLIRDDDFRQISKKLNVYCPFAALAVEEQEIRHSNFLADILNPHKPHGFGDTCLRSFLATLLDATGENESLLWTHLQDLSQVRIHRERRDIDLAIEFPATKGNAGGGFLNEGLVLVIEVKVGGSEGAGQLARYEEVAKEEWGNAKQLFFFLTRDGDEASSENWKSISFADMVDGFQSVLDNGHGRMEAGVMLTAYIAMIRRQRMDDHELNELAKQIWQKHGDALRFLVDNQPDTSSAMNEISNMLDVRETAQSLTSRLASVGCQLNVVVDHDNRYSTRHILRFAIEEWDEINGMIGLRDDTKWTPSKRVLLIEIWHGAGERMATFFVVGPGPQEVREKFIRVMEDSGVVTRGQEKIKQKTTRLGGDALPKNRLRTIEEMQKIVDDGIPPEEIDKIRKEFIDYWAAIIPKIHEAFGKAGML